LIDEELISGLTVHYFVTCPREAWLYAHKIYPDQEDENILMGKALAEIREDEIEDVGFGNVKIDRVDRKKGHYHLIEYKKSLKNPFGAKMQLLYYMYLLKKAFNLKKIDGKVVSGKKVVYVEGSEENFALLEKILDELRAFLALPKPPEPKPIRFCKRCGYRNYCF
jgi:CRISPR-associated exonuclease Cas4